MQRFRLYDTHDLEAVLRSMARQFVAMVDPREPIVLVGVLRRGAPLAERLLTLARGLQPALQVERLDLKVKRYGDDLTLLHPDTRLDRPESAPELAGRHVVVIDDVLYQGHSLFKVLEFLKAAGAASVRAAVLVDRQVSHFPIHADIVGLRLQVAPGDVVECNVPPYEAEWAIDLCRPDPSA
jgi:pyrimidine operon attenuation protein/uracil phosphoribosyltransferase